MYDVYALATNVHKPDRIENYTYRQRQKYRRHRYDFAYFFFFIVAHTSSLMSSVV